MTVFLSTFLNPIFPIFAVMLVGIALARWTIFNYSDAQAVNKFVFYVAMPALLFGLLTNADFSQLDKSLPLIYFLSGAISFCCAALVSRRIFKRSLAEALLLGMATSFVNHAFFILPIATILYGHQAAELITILIVIDISVVFGGMTIVMELMQRSNNQLATVKKLITNPVLIAIFLGCMVNLLQLNLHEGIHTYTTFVGKSAPPASMFALGIIIASRRQKELDLCALSITTLKLVLFPALVWIAFQFYAFPPGTLRNTLLLTGAGPCGAMPFVLAVQYGISPDSIGRAIIYSTLLSLITLAFISQGVQLIA